jgi:hypothetical protein
MDANKVLDRFQANLNYEISQQTDVNSAAFIIRQVVKGNAGNEDLVELRGYYKGLKVAREILERIIAEESENTNEKHR